MNAAPVRARNALRNLTLVGLAVTMAAHAPDGAAAQDFDPGQFIPGVRLAVGRDAYDVMGSTAPQIMRQLQTAGRPSWVRYPALFTWSYDAEVLPHAIRGTPSDQCGFTDFEVVLDFTAVYPRWTAPSDASPELVEAWAAFERQVERQVERQWASERDEYIARAAEAVRRARDFQDSCPLLAQRFHSEVLELLDRSRSVEGREWPDRPGLSWPPTGFEHLMEVDAGRQAEHDQPAEPDASGGIEAPVATGDARRPAVEIRPGMPRPVSTPAASLDAAIRTDLLGTQPTGLVAALYHQGSLEYLNAFGTVPGSDVELTIDTRLPVPAFTETLVSTLAFALGELDILELDAPVSTYLDGTPPGIGAVTTRQLLEHRAGLDNAPPRDSTMAWDEVMDRLNDRVLFTEPGVLPSYSIYSYALAVRVIERATGTSLEDALERTLLNPLGMASTTLGARDADGVVGGLPIAHTSAADLLRFWYSWLDGGITGAGVGLTPDPGARTLALDGRAFRGGLWIDRPGAVPRVSLVCGTDTADTLIQVFPNTNSLVLVIGLGAWPRHTGVFMLDALGQTLRMGNEVFSPVRLRGVAGFGRRERACRGLGTSRAYRPVDFGPRAETSDWAGRYVNGDWFFALEDVDGLLTSPRPAMAPWNIHHFEGDTYFASVPPAEGEGIGFPFRLFRGPDGRRYLMLADRAYLHEDDRPPRR